MDELDAIDFRLEHLIKVEEIDDCYVKLVVNGYGVATWDTRWFEGNDHTAKEYVTEVARVLREALAKKKDGP